MVPRFGFCFHVIYVFFSVKDIEDDCEVIYLPTDEECIEETCINVRCVQVMRVLAKFSANPKSFPYDIQKPYLEFKSKAYPISLLKELV